MHFSLGFSCYVEPTEASSMACLDTFEDQKDYRAPTVSGTEAKMNYQ